MSRDCIYIIDTFSLMFQVFHAIPPMIGTQGQPTNAVFGFTRDIFRHLRPQTEIPRLRVRFPGAWQTRRDLRQIQGESGGDA